MIPILTNLAAILGTMMLSCSTYIIILQLYRGFSSNRKFRRALESCHIENIPYLKKNVIDVKTNTGEDFESERLIEKINHLKILIKAIDDPASDKKLRKSLKQFMFHFDKFTDGGGSIEWVIEKSDSNQLDVNNTLNKESFVNKAGG